jgi:predicted CoA-substrate-specific enzyme activase
MICVGVDAGSRTIKVVVLESHGHRVLGSGVADQGVEQNAIARRLLQTVLDERGILRQDVRAIVATGYGRKLITEAAATITEISCQAAGVSHCLPQARTVIDIGGQDSKLLHLAAGGSITDFSMNDRCAAGTGRFLEVVAARMGVRLAGLGQMVSRSRRPAVISSMCVVFAESEIIGLLAQGATPEDIIAGVQASIAARVAAMAGRRVAPPVVFTGGVALVPGMSVALGTALGEPVTVAPDPQLTCALGAAILAAKKSS